MCIFLNAVAKWKRFDSTIKSLQYLHRFYHCRTWQLVCLGAFYLLERNDGQDQCNNKIYEKLRKISQFWAELGIQDLIINRCIKLRVSPKNFDFQPNTVDFSLFFIIFFGTVTVNNDLRSYVLGILRSFPYGAVHKWRHRFFEIFEPPSP